MDAFRALRLSVIAFFITMAALVAIGYAEVSGMPPAVLEWMDKQPMNPAAVAVGIASLLGVFVGSAALLARKKWGAWAHVVATVLGTAAGFGMGAEVIGPASAALNALVMTLTGLIYGLAFFTDALAEDPRGEPAPAEIAH